MSLPQSGRPIPSPESPFLRRVDSGDHHEPIQAAISVWVEELLAKTGGQITVDHKFVDYLEDAAAAGQAPDMAALATFEERLRLLDNQKADIARLVVDGQIKAISARGPDWTLHLSVQVASSGRDDNNYEYPEDYDHRLYNPTQPMFTSLECTLCCGVGGQPAVSRIKQLLQQGGLLPMPEPEPASRSSTRTSVTFAFPSTHGIAFRKRLFPSVPIAEIRRNYTPPIAQAVDNLLPVMQAASSGLVLLNGPAGTGKSYLIRSLLTELREQRLGLICCPATSFLSNIDLLVSAATKFSKTLLVLEDVGEMVAVDNVSTYVNESSNLLNLSEGLLALVTDVLVIVTFNYDLAKVNPALLRPGRCLGHLTVGLLPPEQAQELVGFPIPKRQYSLAEVYQMRRDGKALEDKQSRDDRRPFGLR